jgi:large conductance mechanosensitive channel
VGTRLLLHSISAKFKGDFIKTVVAFVITASVIYFVVVLPFNRMSEIPIDARRCAFCTAELGARSAAGSSG